MATVLINLNFTYAHAHKATARKIHGNAPKWVAHAPEKLACAREFFSSARITIAGELPVMSNLLASYTH